MDLLSLSRLLDTWNSAWGFSLNSVDIKNREVFLKSS